MSVQVLMVLAAVWPAAVDPTKPTRWEYRVLTAHELYKLGTSKNSWGLETRELQSREFLKGVETGLNKLGDEGWELVSVDGTGGRTPREAKYIFKRPSVKPAPPPDKAPPKKAPPPEK
jgi:hypothetical protein